ncbi:hypothetical protein ACKI1O_52345, partial [Streptomyces scabiei]
MGESIEPFFTLIAVVFEAIGAIAMVVGFLIAVALSARSLRRTGDGRAAFLLLRNTLGSAIL